MRDRTRPLDLLFECEGVNNVNSPSRISITNLSYGKKGIVNTEIAYGMNVVVTEDRKLDRADGYSKVVSLTDGHSMFYKPGGSLLVCDGTTMYVIGTDYSKTSIKTGLSGDFVSYDQNGNETYFGDGTNVGKVYGGLYEEWAVGTWRGVDTDRYHETAIPAFSQICFHNHNRCFGVVGNALYQSEVGEFGLWNLEDVFLLPTDIRMVGSVASGLVVSDGRSVWFCKGHDIREFKYTEVLPYPALGNSLAAQEVVASEIELQGEEGSCVFFNTKEGPCMCTPSGSVVNLTREKVSYPAVGEYGASLVRGFDMICVDENEFCTQTMLKVGAVGKKATTNRSNFEFNSFARRGEEYLACKSDGIYLLGGDDYDGTDIDATFIPRTIDFENKSGIDFVYTGASSATGALTITPTVDGTAYAAGTAFLDATHVHARTKMAKGLNGRLWSLRFSNTDGSDFSIERIQYLTRPKSRAYPT